MLSSERGMQSLAIVSPWLPSDQSPYRGNFIATSAEASSKVVGDVTIYHVNRQLAVAESSASKAAPASIGAGSGTRYKVTRATFALHPEADVESVVREGTAALRETVGGELPESVVHAHGGLRGGWPAIQLARRGARVFVTEHVSFPNGELSADAARSMYDEVMARCTRFFCVSRLQRSQLRDFFPRYQDKIDVAPNAVAFERVKQREAPVTELRRWLYLGNFVQSKGIDQLIDAFARCHDADPALSLTLVGDGPHAPAVADKVAELRLQDAITILDGVPYPEAFRLLQTHDLLAHASEFETFGLTPIEAIACGTPVLVTRCGGPEETLRDVIADAGEFVPVSDGPDELVDGYRRLRSRVHSLNLERARRNLAKRYGLDAVGAFLRDQYFGS
jgi:glycogen synthase